MYQNIIKNYLNNLNKIDIKNYLNKENIIINEKDLNTIYNYIKIYNIDILKNPLFYLEDIKGKINNNLYNNIIILYNKNKNKLSNIR